MSREAYHEYFQGYMEVTQTDQKGIERIKRVYVADYHRAEISDAGWKCGKIISFLCWLGAVLLFMISAVKNLPCNTTVYAGVTQSLTALALLLWSFTMGEYLLTGRNLTVSKFRTVHEVLVKRSMAGAICLALCAAAVLAGMMIQRDTEIVNGMSVVTGHLAGAFLCFFAGNLEKRRTYVRIENSAAVPEDSVMIR